MKTRHLLSFLLPVFPLVGTALSQAGNLTGLNVPGTNLVFFDAGNPGVILGSVPILNLQAGERLVGIDYRPSTGELVGVGSSSRIYVVDPVTGIATAVSATAFSPPLNGRVFGVDFNPVPDRIRVVSNTDQNLRLHPDTGVVTVDTPLTYDLADPSAGQNPFVGGAAYTKSFAGATQTTLYAIDSDLDTLVTIGGPNGVPSPNGGLVFTVGPLGIDAGGFLGFDVSPFGGAFAAINVAGDPTTKIFTVNLTTGAATLLGTVGGVRLRDIAVPPPAPPRIRVVNMQNRLLSFAPGRPTGILSNVPITGLAAGEVILGIDFRPSTGGLTAVGSTNRLYSVDSVTGVATPIGAAPFSPALSGASFGFDFNPTVDRIRVVSDAEQNLRLHPVTGALAAMDTPLAYATGDSGDGVDPRVVGSAYTNSFAGSTVTTLYGIDSGRDVLVTQGSLNSSPVSPNTGQLFTVGSLGIDAQDRVGFDVSQFGGAFAVMTPSGVDSELYRIDLATGAATLIGKIGSGTRVSAMAFETPVLPVAFGFTTGNVLVSFLIGSPGSPSSTVPVTGLAGGEELLGIDFRPATGSLLGLGSTSRLYGIDMMTGVATPIGGGPFSPALAGTRFGFDFNPTVDRIRTVSDADQNLRLHPGTGAVVLADTMLTFVAGDPNVGMDPNVVGSAYTGNFAGSTVTTLYSIDSVLDVLVTQGSLNSSPVSPNSGQLFTIGSLGLDASDLVGFDVSSLGGSFASLSTSPGVSTLYGINLTSGAASSFGVIGAGSELRGFALRPTGL